MGNTLLGYPKFWNALIWSQWFSHQNPNNFQSQIKLHDISKRHQETYSQLERKSLITENEWIRFKIIYLSHSCILCERRLLLKQLINFLCQLKTWKWKSCTLKLHLPVYSVNISSLFLLWPIYHSLWILFWWWCSLFFF